MAPLDPYVQYNLTFALGLDGASLGLDSATFYSSFGQETRGGGVSNRRTPSKVSSTDSSSSEIETETLSAVQSHVAASGSKPPVGPIVGGTVGGVVGLILILLAIFMARRHA
jgi:hypothetical protein